ncbi:MAG TPA: metallopeptidase TldD-related protein [Candidatus Binataceae bacterium]|nr:metallopeptidase TldD-related protein [Candidatus Binataceae bacterium]
MRSRTELKNFLRESAALIARERDLSGFEIYASASEDRVARINYTSDIPSRGVEEFKSLNAEGFALRIVMKRDGRETGTAAIAGDLSLEAVRDGLTRARNAIVVDPHFSGLPSEPAKLPAGSAASPSDLLRANDGLLAAAAWRVIGVAITTFRAKGPPKLQHPGLIVGGDFSVIRDRIAVTNSNYREIRSDESARFVASITVLAEALEAKGTASAIGGSIDEMTRASARLGREAVLKALALQNGERPLPGSYRVVLGPQPLAEIVNYMVLPSLTTGAFHASSSAYHGRFGTRVMDARLSLIDDPLASNGPVRRRITCEGLPTAKTDLIKGGQLVGLLSNFYDARRLINDPNREEKLGTAGNQVTAFPVRSGYRLGDGGARRFDAHPGASGTNVIMRAREGVSDEELIKLAGEGIYVGRVWYTYPINGQRNGDFTCTVSGDSHVIRGGKLAKPLAPNCLRVNANIAEVFTQPLALGRRAQAASVWGSPEAYFMPALLADGITLAAIGAADSD